MAAVKATDITLKAAQDALKNQNKQSAQNMLNGIVGKENTAGSAGNSNMQSGAAASQPPQGMLGIRDTLVSRGVDTKRIGWNDGTKSVTLDGQDVFKPTSVIDGKSYASQSDIDGLTNAAYSNSGNPIKGATSYAAASGLSNAARWSDGKLMIGGNQVPVKYVDNDGKAYAAKSDMDAAIDAYRKQSGIVGNQEIYNNWNEKYGGRIEDALQAILNREKWSYNAEDDPAYRAYRDAYTREGNRAYQNAYAQMAANTGGYGSSAGMTAAGQQMNYYMQQLNNRIPELMQNSYNRYMNEQELNRAALQSLMNVGQSDYSKQYQANRDSISDVNAANYYDYLRDKDARDYNRSVETEDRLWDYNKQLYADKVLQSKYDTSRYEQNADLDLQSKQIASQLAAMQGILSRYTYTPDTPISARDAQMAGITPKADGTYPTARELQENYARLNAAAQLMEWNEYGKPQMMDAWKINNGYGM